MIHVPSNWVIGRALLQLSLEGCAEAMVMHDTHNKKTKESYKNDCILFSVES